MDYTTCIWYLDNSEWVKLGPKVEWIIDLETVSKWQAIDYHAWATNYYERELEILILEELFDGNFSSQTAAQLNSEIDMNALKTDLEEIGVYS